MKQLYQGLVACIAGALILVAGLGAITFYFDSKAAPSGAVSASGQTEPIGLRQRKGEDVPFVEGRTHESLSWLEERCLGGYQFLVADRGRTITQVRADHGGGIKCPK